MPQGGILDHGGPLFCLCLWVVSPTNTKGRAGLAHVAAEVVPGMRFFQGQKPGKMGSGWDEHVQFIGDSIGFEDFVGLDDWIGFT